MKTKTDPNAAVQPPAIHDFNQASAQRVRRVIRAGPLLAASLLWLVSGLPVAGQSTLQFLERGYIVNEDAGEVVVNVSRRGDLDIIVTVDYATEDGTAIAGEDYVAVSGTLTFAAGQTTQSFSVPILNDGQVESGEIFTLILTNPSQGAVLSGPSKNVRIIDNDTGPRFASTTHSTVQDIGSVWIGVHRGDDGDQPVTVDYETIDDSAMAGQHYEPAQGTLHFDADEFFLSIPVVILNAGVDEANKSFKIQLADASSGGVGNPSLATVTIQDPTPLIYQQPTPASQSVSLGVTARIQVSAKGALMQWQHRVGEGEFVDIPGATSQVLEWSSATVDLTGEYRFIVASTSGDSVISQIATVEVDPTFVKISGQPLVEDRESSHSAVWFDYDRDGWVDLLVPNHLDHAREPRPRSSLYRNQGDGTFAKVTNPLAADLGGIYPAVCADFDNDGHTDVFMAESLHFGGYRGHIFLNHGSGLIQALPHNLGAAFGAAARDIDGDGWVDLVLFKWDFTSVYRNLGEGQFQRLTLALGALGSAPSVSGCFVDFDNDGRPDLHLPREDQPGRLLRNVGGFAFDQVQAGSLPGTVNNIGSAWADYDNDGFFDLLTVSSAYGGDHAPRLHRNVPHPTDPSRRVFDDVSASSGLLQLAGSTFGMSWGDFNNDGYLDLFLARSGHLGSASTNTLMINQGDGTFISVNVGTPLHPSPSFSAHWGDYDNDGFLDLFVACGWTSETPNFLFRNLSLIHI